MFTDDYVIYRAVSELVYPKPFFYMAYTNFRRLW